MADENRRMSEQFGDLEYEYDLLDHLDPIARAGFDPSRVRVGDPNDRMTSADSHYQPLSDMITINPRDLANKATHAHEFRERGIDILLEELRRDGFEFIQKYGKDLYLKLSDLRDAIKNQNRARMIKDGDYNKNFEEMISEFYEKHEDVNQGAEYYAGELFSPKFGYVRGETARDSRITTPAEKMALLKEHQRKTGTPIIKYVPPPDTAQEQMDRLETDNQVAFREYLKTNPADRVERAFFKTPYAEGERRRTRPLFESVELLSQFAEKQNKKYGVRDPENFAQGGPVMRGIGTLNETARNMFRGPRGIGAYQQFADGGPAQNDLNRLNTLFENAPSNNFTLTEAPFVFMPNESELSALERERLESTYGGDNRYVFEKKKLPVSGTIQYQKNRDGSKRFDAEIEKKFKGELGSITPSARYSTQRSSKRSGNTIVDETGRQVGFAVEGEIYIDPDSENKLKGAIDVENSKKSRSFTIPEGQILKTEDGTLLKKFNLGVDLGSLGLDATYFDDSKKGTRAEGSATIKIGDNGIIKYNDSSDGRPTFSAKYATDVGDGEANLNYENDLRNVPRYGAELNTKFGEGVGSLSYRNDGRGNTFGAKYNITFASGGEVSGPPPTRGPDPQGIGYFQQFADGGPVYMSNGGEGSVESIKDGVLQTVFDVESNGDFNRWHDDAQNIPETPLTKMTVSEIMGYQRGENGPAAGAGQIKYNTFQYLLNTGTLKPDEVFSPQVQRKAHFRLLDRRGFNEWVQGELSNDGFIQRLAREYAAVPLAQDEQVGDTLRESGKSRYGGSNAHRISLDNMRNVLTSLKSPSMASEAALDEAMYAADYLEPQTMPLFAEPEEAGPDLIDAQTFDSGVGSIMSPTTGEELRQGFRPRFGSPAQEDDYMSMVPQKISMRDKYSTENIAADLVGGKEALEEGIGGLTRSLRPNLRPPSVEFKGGVSRSLMPRYRPELEKEYPGNDTDALMRGLRGIRGRTLRKGFTPYVQDVRGELT